MPDTPNTPRRRPARRGLLLGAAACLLWPAATGAAAIAQDSAVVPALAALAKSPPAGTGAAAGVGGVGGVGSAGAQSAAPTLEETRLVMGKWIETQQIIAKERNEWQQGEEILRSRLEVVRKEVATLQEKIAEVETSVSEADAKRTELLAEKEQLAAADAQLVAAVTAMEAEVRRLYQSLPAPLQETLQPLHQRMPADTATTRVSAAERFQNVLGILNELNKANNEISVSYEVRTLADGKPSEVKALYVGLAQAYYVSAQGEAGTGQPGADGWTWQPSKAIANDVLRALEILQGKHTPAFVPLPVTIQ
jgi:hypothetical protein